MASFVLFQNRLFLFFALILFVAACNPYPNQQGEFNAGPVDAANFALPYKGANADTNVYGYLAGRGTFTEIRAYIGNNPAGYYSFPFPASQLAETDPLVVYGDPGLKKPYTPNAYVFDPATPNPFPLSQKCSPPPNYVYNEEMDVMRLDEQGNIFTLLPIATEKPGQASTFDYIPVVAEIGVTAQDLACQSLKSERTLNKVLGTPRPTGNLLLWAIIDPAAGVYRVGEVGSPYRLSDGGFNPAYSRGQRVQRWGWFGQYYLAYIDGGYIPNQPLTVTIGTGPRARQIQTPKMITQKLYIPSTISRPGVRCGSSTCTPGQVCQGNVCQSCTADFPVPPATCPAGGRCCPTDYRACSSTGCTASGVPGASPDSYDVLESRRGEAGYSPVCAIHTYTANTSSPPIRPLTISELPRSVAGINAIPNSNPQPASGSGRLIYCPQVD